MRLGKEAMEALRAEITGELKAGDSLVVAGAVALEGTKRLAKIEYEELRAYFSEGFLKEASRVQELYGVGEDAAGSEAGSTRCAGSEAGRSRHVSGIIAKLNHPKPGF